MSNGFKPKESESVGKDIIFGIFDEFLADGKIKPDGLTTRSVLTEIAKEAKITIERCRKARGAWLRWRNLVVSNPDIDFSPSPNTPQNYNIREKYELEAKLDRAKDKAKRRKKKIDKLQDDLQKKNEDIIKLIQKYEGEKSTIHADLLAETRTNSRFKDGKITGILDDALIKGLKNEGTSGENVDWKTSLVQNLPKSIESVGQVVDGISNMVGSDNRRERRQMKRGVKKEVSNSERSEMLKRRLQVEERKKQALLAKKKQMQKRQNPPPKPEKKEVEFEIDESNIIDIEEKEQKLTEKQVCDYIFTKLPKEPHKKIKALTASSFIRCPKDIPMKQRLLDIVYLKEFLPRLPQITTAVREVAEGRSSIESTITMVKMFPAAIKAVKQFPGTIDEVEAFMKPLKQLPDCYPDITYLEGAGRETFISIVERIRSL